MQHPVCGGERVQRVGGGCCVEEEQTTFHTIREPGQGLGICITGVGVCQHITERKMRCASLCVEERGFSMWEGAVVLKKNRPPSASSGNQAKA